jgi:hypothetical protein
MFPKNPEFKFALEDAMLRKVSDDWEQESDIIENLPTC